MLGVGRVVAPCPLHPGPALVPVEAGFGQARRVADGEVVQGVLDGAVDVALHRGATLRFVAVEQMIRRGAVDDGGELPGQIVGVLHRAGRPQASGRGVAVRGVADEEHPADP